MLNNCCFLSLSVLAAVVALAAPPATAPAPIPDFAKHVPEVKSGDPVFAFNGKNLDGWYSYLRDLKYEDPDRVFTVKDGELHISGQHFGGLTTKAAYGNYHLVTEWKWGEKTWVLPVKGLERPKGAARDAGILVHAVGADGASYQHWMESIEVQIIEGGVGDFLILRGATMPSLTCVARADGKQFYFDPAAGAAVTKTVGRFNWWGRDPKWTDTLGVRDAYGVEKPHGEWNRLEVVCDEDRITSILNGVVVNVGTNCNRKEGKIQLQSEGAEIVFRKVEVRPLVK